MTELEKAKALIFLQKVIDDATSDDKFPHLDFHWEENTTELMALAALKALEKEIKKEVMK
jgi:hypothetical protein